MGIQASKVVASTRIKKRNIFNRRHSSSTNDQFDNSTFSALDRGNGKSASLDTTVFTPSQKFQQKQSKNIVHSVNSLDSLSPLPSSYSSKRRSISNFFARRNKTIVLSPPQAYNEQEELKEQDRLQRQHYLLKSQRKGNVWAPIVSPEVVIDVGTGSGIWALEMATSYPNTQILGLDIKLPPLQQNSPSNLKYVEVDITETWPIDDNTVDFIFQRTMYRSVKKEQWKNIVEEMYRVLKPGGYVELLEPNLDYSPLGPKSQEFFRMFSNQCEKEELDLNTGHTLTDNIEILGFEEIKKLTVDIPIGEWPEDPDSKRTGFVNMEIHKALLKNNKSDFMTKWKLTTADYDKGLNGVLDEFEEYHTSSGFICWIARKPQV